MTEFEKTDLYGSENDLKYKVSTRVGLVPKKFIFRMVYHYSFFRNVIHLKASESRLELDAKLKKSLGRQMMIDVLPKRWTTL